LDVFSAPATTEIYTLSLHDALPILCVCLCVCIGVRGGQCVNNETQYWVAVRSEEHTSELQSHLNIVCRLPLDKKNQHVAEPSSTRHTCSYQHLLRACRLL